MRLGKGTSPSCRAKRGAVYGYCLDRPGARYAWAGRVAFGEERAQHRRIEGRSVAGASTLVGDVGRYRGVVAAIADRGFELVGGRG